MARPLRGELTSTTSSETTLEEEQESEISSEDSTETLNRLLGRVLSRPVESKGTTDEGIGGNVNDIIETERVLLPCE